MASSQDGWDSGIVGGDGNNAAGKHCRRCKQPGHNSRTCKADAGQVGSNAGSGGSGGRNGAAPPAAGRGADPHPSPNSDLNSISNLISAENSISKPNSNSKPNASPSVTGGLLPPSAHYPHAAPPKVPPAASAATTTTTTAATTAAATATRTATGDSSVTSIRPQMSRNDPRLAFAEGEKVLCFHGPLLYEAKVVQAQYLSEKEAQGKEGGPYYYVHYHGWKSSWDEWVPQSRMIKFDAEGIKRQADLSEMIAAKKAAAAAKGPDRSKLLLDVSADRGKKRRRDSTMEKEEPYMKRPEIKITIPELLKLRLVDDWENVTKNHKLVSLPRDVTVVQILERFREFVEGPSRKRSAKENAGNCLNEVIEGLKLYFDRALGSILLYRFEREQYVDILQRFPNTPMSQIYGPEHFLRLFVQLPVLIVHTSMDQDAVNILCDYFAQILAFLQKHHDEFFLAEYDIAPPEYISILRK